MSIFNEDKNDHLAEPMFLGNGVNVARFDEVKYPWIEKFTEKQLGFFWRETEVDLSTDRSDYEGLSDNEKHIFTSNLKYQILLDSVQGRAPSAAFLPVCSLPELEAWIVAWTFIESIHSRSYTHIIRNVYNHPSEVLDHILDVPQIIDRASAVTKDYDNLIAMNSVKHPLHNTREHKITLMRTLMSVNILEGIRFYVSFACTFSFAERNLMAGSAAIVKLICRDEAIHLAATQRILQAMAQGDEGSEWQGIFLDCMDDMDKMFEDAVQQECDWADYLFKDGSMMGLNAAILKQYVQHIADKRIEALGLPAKYKQTNPIPWMNAWTTSTNVQVAPQEQELSSYITGGLDVQIDDGEFGEFKL